MQSEANRFDPAAFLAPGKPWLISSDLVRATTLELLANEIRRRDVPGAVAEVGVLRGDFASLMNHHFPDRPLHLFDTFEGFDRRDWEFESGMGLGTRFVDLSRTSVDTVMAKLPHPQQATIHKGWFPASAADLGDQTFALASIDVDLYQAILAALEWFYPRLAPGGYLMIHDFNNDLWRGVREAVVEFADRQRLQYVPLPDFGGTVVIGKPHG